MKKILTILALCAVCVCCAVGFAACDNGQSTSEEENKQILEIYNMYVVYADEQGLTPKSYEEWLLLIKGEKGDKGDKGEDGKDGITPTIEISADGYWIINGVKTEYVAIGKDGKDGKDGVDGIDGVDGQNGKDGKDGQNGTTPTIEISDDGFWVINGIKTEYKATGNNDTPTPPVHTHDYTKTVIAPTCTTYGYTIYQCTCGNEYTDNYVAALGHNYEWTITKEPTETEQGEKQGICTVCGDIMTQPIPRLNHEHNYIITVIEPTCTEWGYTLYKCTCGAEYYDNYTYPTGHNYGEWVLTTEPTCTTTGVETRYCSHDNTHTETRTVNKLAHNYQSEIIAPTCTEQGYTTYACSMCEYSYNANYVAAIGHDLVEDSEPFGDCALSMKQEFLCIRCDEIVAQTVNVQAPDTHNNLAVGTTCQYCGWSVYTKNGDSVLMYDGNNNLSAEFYGTETHTFTQTLREHITNVYLSESVTNIGEYAFCSCSSLTSITIPNSVTNIESHAFFDCSNLTQLIIGHNVLSISDHAFFGCHITELIIPDSVISIGFQAFQTSTLINITIGRRVEQIDNYAFTFSEVVSVIYTGTKAQWNAIIRGANWMSGASLNTVVHCTDGDVAI